MTSLTQIVRRWWWLLVIVPLIGMVLGYVVASRQEPLYAASTQIMVTPAGTSGIDNGAIQGAQNLAGTYQQLIGSTPVLERVIADLGLPLTVDELRAKLTTTVVPNTLLIEITASDGDPERAALIANSVAQTFHDYILLQSTAVNVDVVPAVPAQPPTDPYAPRTPLYVALGAIVGLLVACGIVALLEYLDNSIRTGTDAVSLVGRPVLGLLPHEPKLRRYPATYLPFATHPNEPFAEAIRHLRTRIAHLHAPDSRVFVAVTSARTNDGKTTLVANLGVSLAQAGYLVALVDADLRHPKLHERFGVSNDRGLSSLTSHPDQPWQRVAVDVGIQNLALIPSGPALADSIDLLDGARLQRVLAAITEEFNVILIDTPALLDFSDGIAAAKQADGAILVCRPGRTSREELVLAASSLFDAGVQIEGLVMNQQKGRGPAFSSARINAQAMLEMNGYATQEEEPSMEPSIPR